MRKQSCETDVFILRWREGKTERQTGNRGVHGETERGRRRESAERDKYLHPVVGEKVVRGRERLREEINKMDRGTSETESQKLLKLGTKSTLIGHVSQRR